MVQYSTLSVSAATQEEVAQVLFVQPEESAGVSCVETMKLPTAEAAIVNCSRARLVHMFRLGEVLLANLVLAKFGPHL